MSTRAFTLVELLVVIILVAVLAAIAVPKFGDSTVRAKEAQLMAQLKLLREAGDRAETDTGLTFSPDALASANPPANGWRRGRMNSSWTQAAVPSGSWRGPYLNEVPLNPFTNTRTVINGNGENRGAWTHWSAQSFNSSYFFFASRTRGSDGREYREW